MSEIFPRPSKVKTWLVAARPWALPASTMPVIYGTTLAYVIGNSRFSLLRFALALTAIVLLHSAANMLSDVFDFKRGLDQEITPVSGALVRGWLSASRVARVSAILFLLGIGIGIVLVKLTGAVILLWIGSAGVAIGASYTVLKARALGDLAVFLNFGILGSLGAYLVQKPYFSWIPVVWTVPLALLVTAILHANNWRDSISDREKKVTTLAALLGDQGSMIYFGLLIFGPFLIILGLIFVPRFLFTLSPTMPLPSAAVLAALPQAFSLWKRARRRHSLRQAMDFILLDAATARFNLIFGLILTASLWLQYFLENEIHWLY